MSRYKMTVCFDGTNYHGWQVQPNAIAVQPTIQTAFEPIIGFRPAITGCSRTDSGVHANEYCFHFDYNGSISEQSLVKAINTKLPYDIAAIDCKKVSDDFHARYRVKTKEYIYKFYNAKNRNPFYHGYSYYTNIKLDEQIMNCAANQFIGKYDYSGFCSSGSSVAGTVRCVKNANVQRNGDFVTFTVEADGFLYNMVRIMAGTLYYVALGKIEPDNIKDIILSKNRDAAGITMPPFGLYLNKVNY